MAKKKITPTTTILFLDFKRKKLIGGKSLDRKGKIVSQWGKTKPSKTRKPPVEPDDEPA